MDDNDICHFCGNKHPEVIHEDGRCEECTTVLGNLSNLNHDPCELDKFKVIKRYHYRQALVSSDIVLPRSLCKSIEDECVRQSKTMIDNHVVFLVDSNFHDIAFYFHDFVCIIGTKENIRETST